VVDVNEGVVERCTNFRQAYIASAQQGGGEGSHPEPLGRASYSGHGEAIIRS
jgi:hypothetical protein